MIHPADIDAEFIGWIPSIRALNDDPIHDSLDVFMVDILRYHGCTNMGVGRDARYHGRRTTERRWLSGPPRSWKNTIRNVCASHPRGRWRGPGLIPVDIFIFDRFAIDLPPADIEHTQMYAFHSLYIPWKALEKVEDLYAK